MREIRTQERVLLRFALWVFLPLEALLGLGLLAKEQWAASTVMLLAVIAQIMFVRWTLVPSAMAALV
jgi:hypothetical protein